MAWILGSDPGRSPGQKDPKIPRTDTENRPS